MNLLVRQSVRLFVFMLLVLLLGPVLFSTASAAGSEGPGSGGGGGVIAVGENRYLIDYLTILSVDELINASQAKGDFQKRASSQFFSIRPNKDVKNSSFKKATEIFTKWENVPFNFSTSLISTAMYAPLKWQFVDELSRKARYFSPPNLLLTDAKVETAAYYTLRERSFTVQIDRSIWNLMSEMNQVGLVIHEGLRQVQFASLSYFDDESLQRATAVMVLCPPSVKLNQYVFLLISNQPKLAEERMGSFADVTAHCRKGF